MKQHRFLNMFRVNAALPTPRKPEFRDLQIPSPTPFAPRRGWRFQRIAASFSLALLGLLSVFGYWLQTAPVATVTIDFNPSVELVVNAFHRVIEVRAENPDGQRLIQQLEYKNRSLSEVITTVYDAGVNEGFIVQNQLQYFLVGLIGEDAAAETKLRQAIVNPTSTLRYLYVAKHSSSTSDSWYGIGSSSLSPAFNDMPAISGDRTNDFIESDSIYAYDGHLELMSEAAFVSLATQLGISEAKLAIIIQILIRENQTSNMPRLIQLAMTDINQLALVYLP
jgi:hypothetical protein